MFVSKLYFESPNRHCILIISNLTMEWEHVFFMPRWGNVTLTLWAGRSVTRFGVLAVGKCHCSHFESSQLPFSTMEQVTTFCSHCSCQGWMLDRQEIYFWVEYHLNDVVGSSKVYCCCRFYWKATDESAHINFWFDCYGRDSKQATGNTPHPLKHIMWATLHVSGISATVLVFTCLFAVLKNHIQNT